MPAVCFLILRGDCEDAHRLGDDDTVEALAQHLGHFAFVLGSQVPVKMVGPFCTLPHLRVGFGEDGAGFVIGLANPRQGDSQAGRTKLLIGRRGRARPPDRGKEDVGEYQEVLQPV